MSGYREQQTGADNGGGRFMKENNNIIQTNLENKTPKSNYHLKIIMITNIDHFEKRSM